MEQVLIILLLVTVANGAPVLLSYILSHRAAVPVDFGLKLKDGQLLFGTTKTWRGIIISILTTTFIAIILGISWYQGLLIAVFAMSGDLLSSFIKRRKAMDSGSRFLLLDQVPESFLPSLVMVYFERIDLMQVIVIVACFIILELVLSRLLYQFGIRKRPY